EKGPTVSVGPRGSSCGSDGGRSLSGLPLPLSFPLSSLLAGVVPRLLTVVITMLPTPIDQILLHRSGVRIRRQQVRLGRNGISGKEIPRDVVTRRHDELQTVGRHCPHTNGWCEHDTRQPRPPHRANVEL